jgi:nicotinamide mononucleotide adenylyltransferase
MKFKEFIQESKENHAVLAFGRMNPPTTGHGKLVDKVKEVAKENNASHHVVLSHSQDKAKNPLSAESKLKHAKRFFPKTNLSVSDKEHPTFLHHAAKLHKQGVTHLHMIAGSDRVNEYKKKLAQYNGTHKDALYNFKKITVHSAGERDPDAEGTEGMSASKMRAHASGGNFKEFKKGVPSHVPEHHAKELYNDVRHHMGVKESVDASFEELLFEGVHDKAIFKAVFLAGGPGSGKDYVLDNTLAGHGLTEINSDKALEYLMDKKGLDKTMPASEKIERDVARGKAKSMSELRERLALHGRNGVIINGTGDDPEKIKRIKGRLEELGYDTSMIMVNTKDEVSAMRNVERGQRGGRTVPETIRKEKWQSVQNARPDLGKIFGDKYIEFDNSEDLRSAHPEIVKAKKKEMMDIYKQIQKFVNAPPKSKQAKEWVAAELERKDTLTVSKKDAGASPHPDSKAAEEARQLGLDYYGFGRYGKDNKVTHRSVHDKLQPLQAPVAKKVNEEFESFLNETTEEINEGHDLNHKQLLKDKNGKVRTFMLRRSAAKEAHTHDGVVHQMGKGYVIKIKENENVTETIKPIQEERRTSSSSITECFRSAGASIRGTSGRSTSGANETITEGVAESKTKITLAQIRSKKEKAITEAIDMGIEPGLSMAQSGESLGRGGGDNYDKRGKLKPFKEMQGDETTASIGDQKEDELKKVGINLSSFRKRNYAV